MTGPDLLIAAFAYLGILSFGRWCVRQLDRLPRSHRDFGDLPHIPSALLSPRQPGPGGTAHPAAGVRHDGGE